MQKYLMLNDFSGKGILQAIDACGTIHLESCEIEKDKFYYLMYDPDFNCLRVRELSLQGPIYINPSMAMELCPLEIFVKNMNPSELGKLFK